MLKVFSQRARRQKLFDGAKIYHPFLSNNSKEQPLTVRVTHRDNTRPPDLWEVFNFEGKGAAPSSYSEQELHRLLAWHGAYEII